ncbi:hypothetical protein prwr041_25970 [Prevotella herbatica]|uniref:Major fimbrial subunit protein N-terminal domain-containing protein n=1 Tax=Prevotella herbatica TaxID=2801997 RepID=A0ABM7P1U1_9BACT|nr:fimbrial protein [Prevotella herbatica]BCS86704.1 hypothetical protein prwr041_25970 [Prevotella herbatica]
MRTKPAILAFFALATIATQGLFTSCSSDENLSTEKPSTGTQTLKINLKPADTRAAAYTDPGTDAENKINRVTIGIFDKTTGAVKTIQDALNAAAPEIITSQLVADDHILVAVNAPAGTFTGVLTELAFEKSTLGIDDALPVSGTGTVDPANLPMFGAAKITQIGTTPAYTADVAVSHMVAKVTLKSLKVAFDATGAYKDATFTPTEVFMYNVPDKLDFDFYPANTPTSYVYNYLTTPTNTPNYYNGLIGDASLKSYLGTGTLDGTLKDKTLATTSNWGTAGTNLLYLYTMPNNSTKPTQLVIKGSFDPDGKGTTVPVYYPVNINYNSDNGNAAEGTTPKQVYPNKNYIVDVIIKGKGADSPTKSLDPETVTANIVTVNSFVDATQSNTFN